MAVDLELPGTDNLGLVTLVDVAVTLLASTCKDFASLSEMLELESGSLATDVVELMDRRPVNHG